MEIIDHLSKVTEKYRSTAIELHELILTCLNKHSAKLYNNGIIGYGIGEDGNMLMGLSVRSAGVMLYASADILSSYSDELGKNRTGKTCLRIRKLTDLNFNTLKSIINGSLQKNNMNYGECSG